MTDDATPAAEPPRRPSTPTSPVPVVRVHVAAGTPDDTGLDALCGALWLAGATAITTHPLDDGATALLVGVGDHQHADEIGRVASGAAARAGLRGVTISVELDDAGAALDAWRTHARAWRAGRRLVVAPAWRPDDAGDRRPDDLVIRVDPGHAFGSGSHESTRLALALLEPRVGPGCRVLDVGCGSGVLGIAAALLGAASVTAIDIDPAALDATTRNTATNDVTGRVHTDTRLLDEVHRAGERFDLVLANLLAPVLRGLAGSLAAVLAPGATLVVSGLLTDQAASVTDALGLAEHDRAQDGDWLALALSAADPTAGDERITPR